MFEHDYKNAIEKISASDAWKADTLAKMQAVEQAPKAVHFRAPKQILTTAAVVALIAIPVAMSGNFGSDNASAAPQVEMTKAIAEDTTTESTEEGIAVTENTAMAVPEMAQQDTGTGEAEKYTLSEADQNAALEYALTQNARTETGDFVVKTDADFAGENPTRNLDASQLPQTVPFYQTPTGYDALSALIRDVSAQLGDTIADIEKAQHSDRLYATGVMYRYAYERGTLSVCKLSEQPLATFDKSLSLDKAMLSCYEEIANGVMPLQQARQEVRTHYDIYTMPLTQLRTFSSVQGSVLEQLYHYQFETVQLFADLQTHTVAEMRFVQKAQETTSEPLVPLDVATQRLRDGFAETEGGVVGGYDGTAEILQTELVYVYLSNGTWAPQYRFTLQGDMDLEGFFTAESQSEYTSIVWVYVPATEVVTMQMTSEVYSTK